MEERKYKEIEAALRPYESILVAASQAVLDQDVSNYPIFVISKLPISVGLEIIPKTAQDNWMVNISSLEEFSVKQLIRQDRINDFRKIFKPVSTHFCLFVLSDLGPQFIFMPNNT